MANPQKENGHLCLANEIVENLARVNMSPYESRLLWAIFRKTYGWNKKVDLISITQLEEITSLDRRNVSRTKRKLIERHLIVEVNGRIGFNKDYDVWDKGVSTETHNTVVYEDTRPIRFQKYSSVANNKLKRFDERCEYCLELFPWDKTNNHHILPKKHGGRDLKQNLARICVDCHFKIHGEIEEWFCVSPDDKQGCYRHFMSKLSSKQTHFLSSQETPQKTTNKDTNTKEMQDDCRRFLEIFNTEFKTTYTSIKGLVDNFTYWSSEYSLEDMRKAMQGSKQDDYWKGKVTPTLLLRQKNPRGEKVDYIGQFKALFKELVLFTVNTPAAEEPFTPLKENDRQEYVSDIRSTLASKLNM